MTATQSRRHGREGFRDVRDGVSGNALEVSVEATAESVGMRAGDTVVPGRTAYDSVPPSDGRAKNCMFPPVRMPAYVSPVKLVTPYVPL